MSEVAAIASASWGVLSAVAVVILGFVSLNGGRTRPRGALSFGLFAVFWGLQVITGNLARLALSLETAQLTHLMLLALSLPTTYFLVEFAISQSDPFRRPGFWAGVRAAAIALNMGVALLLVLAPKLLYRGPIIPTDGLSDLINPDWGILHAPLVIVPQFLAFGLTLLALHEARAGSATPRMASRTTTLFVGLAVYVAFAASNNLTFYVGFFTSLSDARGIAFTLLFLLLTLECLWLGLSNLRLGRATNRAEDRRLHHLVAAALLVPLLWGVVEGILVLQWFPLLETVGLWRLAGVGIIAFGIARWRFYDLPQRAHRVAANAGGAAIAAAGGVATYGAARLATSSSAVPVVVALATIAFSAVPAIRLARRLFGAAAEPNAAPEDALYGQRIDAYRAALEASIARGSLKEDVDFLSALRERFGISEAEDRVLRHYAKSSVIVARDRKAHEAFERLRLLGEGGGGRTWLARDRQRDRLVVLKEPLQQWQQEPHTREAVLREARLAAKVRHPNVVAVEEVVEGKGSPVIVMEYMDGGSLSDLLRARGTLPWREAVPLLLDVLRGVEAIHAAGIVHRDVKPSNILLTGDGTPKVADFGIALPSISTKTVLDVGSTARAGTMFYMAPEVRAGLTSGDRRADVYACAAVLHECLYGAPPGAHAPVILRSDVPAPLTAALARGLSERPDDRIPTARAFAEELGRVLRG